MRYLLLFCLLVSARSFALVTSPVPLGTNDTLVEVKTIRERGKIEPNENRDSFQSAKIDTYQLSVTRGIENMFSFGQDHFFKIDYRYFYQWQRAIL